MAGIDVIGVMETVIDVTVVMETLIDVIVVMETGIDVIERPGRCRVGREGVR